MGRSYAELDLLLAQVEKDGAGLLDRIAQRWPPDEHILEHLIDLIEASDPPLQSAASGLIKRHADAKTAFSKDTAGRLIDLLATVTDSTTKLHLLQILPALEIFDIQAEPLCDCLLECVADRNKFVRAWAYGAFHHLASAHPEYRDEARTLLARAARTESAAVRARLRQLAPLD